MKKYIIYFNVITCLTVVFMLAILFPEGYDNEYVILYGFIGILYSLLHTKKITSLFGDLNLATTIISCYFTWQLLRKSVVLDQSEVLHCVSIYPVCFFISYVIGYILQETLSYVFGYKTKNIPINDKAKEELILEGKNETELEALMNEAIRNEDYIEATKIRNVLEKKFGK